MTTRKNSRGLFRHRRCNSQLTRLEKHQDAEQGTRQTATSTTERREANRSANDVTQQVSNVVLEHLLLQALLDFRHRAARRLL